jgi:hypothetical protein
MTLGRALAALSSAGIFALGLSCSSSSSSPTPPAASPSAPVVAASPTPSPSPAASPSTPAPVTGQSCPYGFGTLETNCGRSGATYVADVDAAIEQVVRQHPDYFETGDQNGPGGFRVLKPHEYQVAVVGSLQAGGFCAETDDDTVAVKKTTSFSETYDILLATGHVRRGDGAYRETCNPASFPINAADAIGYVRVAFYSILCDAGITPPRNGENRLPLGCRGFVTATPKRPNNEDVPAHIIDGDISWRFEQEGDIAVIVDDDHNAFNKQVVGRNPGRYTLCATSHGVEGCQHGEIIP